MYIIIYILYSHIECCSLQQAHKSIKYLLCYWCITFNNNTQEEIMASAVAVQFIAIVLFLMIFKAVFHAIKRQKKVKAGRETT